MFSVEQRDATRRRLLDLAASDPTVVGAAITGSHATNSEDRWSDVDLAFAIDGPLDIAMQRWTQRLYEEFHAVHHWDLPSGSAIYRVFLLPGCLEVDIAFTPAADFGPHGPSWRTVFGDATPQQAAAPPDPNRLAGLAWHHALHAWTSIQRRRWWQAEHWISALRSHVIALASHRLGHPASYAKGAHLLPLDVTTPLEATLVRTLDETELLRALTATAHALTAELARTDQALADRLRLVLTELNPTQPHPPSG
jgi:hypothetical protein